MAKKSQAFYFLFPLNQDYMKWQTLGLLKGKTPACVSSIEVSNFNGHPTFGIHKALRTKALVLAYVVTVLSVLPCPNSYISLSLDSENIFFYFFSYYFLVGGHTWKCSGLPPGSILRNHFFGAEMQPRPT